MKFGCDVGGVITRAVEEGSDTSFFTDNFLNTPMVDGALESIARIAQAVGPENCFIISKCGENTAEKTRKWLAHHEFYAATGMTEEQVFFCRKRPEKAPIAAELGLDVFVDDRIDVLFHMGGIVPCRVLFDPDCEQEGPLVDALRNDLTVCRSWEDVEEYVNTLQSQNRS